MSDFSKKNVQLTAAKVYIASFDPESSVAEAMPSPTISSAYDNIDAVVAYIEANYTFQRMAGFKNVVISDALENPITNEVDDCDIQEWSKYTDVIARMTGDWLTTLDLDAVEILLGFPVTATTATPVTDEEQTLSSGAWEYNKVYRLGFQHHNASGNIIAPSTLAIEGSVDGAVYVEGTDYEIVDNGMGEFGVTFMDGTNITTLVQDMVITYDYTPLAAEYTGYLIGQTIQPYMITKIVGCPDTDGLYDTWYIVKSSLEGSLDTSFIATGEVPLSSVTIVGGKGGYKFVKRQRLDS